MTLIKAAPLALLALALSFCSALAEDVLHLTPDNYDFHTAGRTLIIKFYAPWCGHCKRMALDWERLADDWKNDPVGLVAQVDCTSPEGKTLCTKFKVRGFPTVKYGDPKDLMEYDGGRTYEDLKTFAKDNLKPPCAPSSLDLCDEATKKELMGWLKKSTEELEVIIKEEKKKLKEMGKEFKKAAKVLKEQYTVLSEEKEKKIKEVRASGLDLVKTILVFKEQKQLNSAGAEL